MGTRYYYDKNGRYKGKSSDTGPDYGWAGFLIIIFLIVVFFGGC